MRIPTELSVAHEALLTAGATRVLIVGGSVRDSIMGRPIHDYDTEVYGMDFASMVDVLATVGNVMECGLSFPVAKLYTGGQVFDFSLPRREVSTGPSHTDFKVILDSTMSVRDACERRDFTMNAMAWDPTTGKFYDFFGGFDDINKGILRHISNEHFAEDPLRVLRAMQFCARFNLRIAQETAYLAEQLANRYQYLSKERIWEEWKKWAKSPFPVEGIMALHWTKWLSLYTELDALHRTKQDIINHPEGNVLIHTVDVVERMSRIAADRSDYDILIFAALLHDVGKAVTTDMDSFGRIHAYGHESVGKLLAVDFLKGIGAPLDYVQTVSNLVAEHMIDLVGLSRSGLRRLAKRLYPATVDQLCCLIQADKQLSEDSLLGFRLVAESEKVLNDKPKPILMGRDLIGWGVMPGPAMGAILRDAFEAQMEGDITDVESAKVWFDSL